MNKLSDEKQKEVLEQLERLMRENPDLRVIPMVDGEICEDYCGYWLGTWGSVKVEEMYNGHTLSHFRGEEDEEDVLVDLAGCKHGDTPDGRRVEDLTEEEQKALYESLPWEKVITVYIGTL